MTVDRAVVEFLVFETSDDGVSWTEWTDALLGVDIERGGSVSGVAAQVEVGVMTATLVNEGNPLDGGTIQPNAIVRVRHLVTDDPIFTGRLRDLGVAYERDAVTGELVELVTVTASDAVRIATTARSTPGFIFGDDMAWRDVVENVGFLVSPFGVVVDAPGSEVTPYRLQGIGPNTAADLWTVACDSIGAVWWVAGDDSVQFREIPDDVAVTATFTDERAVGEYEYTDLVTRYDTRSLVNTLTVINHLADVFGTETNTEYEVIDDDSVDDWGPRVGSIDTCVYSGYVVDTNYAPNPTGLVDLTNLGAVSSSAALTRLTGAAAAALLPPVGSAIIVSTRSVSTGNIGCAITDGSLLSNSGTIAILTTTPGTQYTASVYARVTVARSATMNIRWYDAANAVIGSDSTSSSSSLSTSAWTRMTLTATAPAGAVKAVPYLAATSAAVGNILYATGWQWSVGALVAYFDGATLGGSTTPPSIDLDYLYRWVGIAYASASQELSYVNINDRLGEIAADLAEPQNGIELIAWNAQEDTEKAASIDVQDRVLVRFRGDDFTVRIVGLRHQITGSRWFMSLEFSA